MNPEENGKVSEKAAETTPEKPMTTRRLGKEATISVGVVLTLLAVLVATIIVRIGSAGSDGTPVAAATKNVIKQKSPERPSVDKLFKDDKLFQDVQAKQTMPAEPTFVPAKAAVGKPPRQDDSKFDPFRYATPDRRTTKPAQRAASTVAPPLSMPEPPAAVPTAQANRPSNPPPKHVTPKRDDSQFVPPSDRPSSRLVAPPSLGSRKDKPADLPPAMPAPTKAVATTGKAPSVAKDALPPETAPLLSVQSAVPLPTKAAADRKDDARRRDPPSQRLAGETPRASLPPRPFGDALPPLQASVEPTSSRNRSPVESRPAQRAGSTYTVADGETLFDIARTELGKASRWVEIYELNRTVLGDDFNNLKTGMKLSLPEKGAASLIAEPSSTGYRR